MSRRERKRGIVPLMLATQTALLSDLGPNKFDMITCLKAFRVISGRFRLLRHVWRYYFGAHRFGTCSPSCQSSRDSLPSHWPIVLFLYSNGIHKSARELCFEGQPIWKGETPVQSSFLRLDPLLVPTAPHRTVLTLFLLTDPPKNY